MCGMNGGMWPGGGAMPGIMGCIGYCSSVNKTVISGTDNQPGLGKHTEDMHRRIHEQQLVRLERRGLSFPHTSQEE